MDRPVTEDLPDFQVLPDQLDLEGFVVHKEKEENLERLERKVLLAPLDCKDRLDQLVKEESVEKKDRRANKGLLVWVVAQETKVLLVLLEAWDRLEHQDYRGHQVKQDLLDQLEKEEKGDQPDHRVLLVLQE